MTYPHPREPRRANKSTYFVMGAIVVVLAIAGFFFVHGVKEDAENPVEQTGQPTNQNTLENPPAGDSGANEQPEPPVTPGATGTNQ
ncbi:MAG TPA: hypothetical protein VG742_10065 [Dongiaceae bacterium]|nr:hypothetical protein [Dongiaceae bacterium]